MEITKREAELLYDALKYQVQRTEVFENKKLYIETVKLQQKIYNKYLL